MSRPALKSAPWILALTVVIFLSYWKIVFTKQFSIFWQSEIVNTHYAWYTCAARWIQHGIVPLWDPFRYGGSTFIGEMQNGLFILSNSRSTLRPWLKTACCPSVRSISFSFFLTGS